METLLENNHEQMKTVVETFVIEETAELIYDGEALESWNSLVSELGLKGQTEITKPTKSPIPFLHLKKGLVNVLKTLCPREYKVEDFNVTPIPVEILKLISLSVKENYFEEVKIWYDDKSPDPCAVGINYAYYSKENGSWKNRHNAKESAQKEMTEKGWEGEPYKTYDGEHYLIGKWADVKQSFDELKERAKKRFIEQDGANYRRQIKDAQRALDDLESTAVEKFN